ncbi:hypothetical protein [Thioclava pacifica]|uniref:Uncharacterized protein n=1 Tax=Thioclava pacifica DSM 10166 TaxID=1353537 RepID=A0A074JVN3_9RHOB|nr:hypothetical protein [Thioclava pacifica]KEO53412.1 hypothetical protein TP2_17940 [Thioclava pacifica DSM 10166]
MDFGLKEIGEALVAGKQGLDLLRGGTDYVRGLRSKDDKPAHLSPEELSDLYERLFRAQNALLEMNGLLRDAQDKAREADQRNSKLHRYELQQLALGGFVRRLKEEFRDQEADHMVCATCFEKGFAFILQPSGYVVQCPVCKGVIDMESAERPNPRRKGIV